MDDQRFDELSQAIARLTGNRPAPLLAVRTLTRRLLLGGLAASSLNALLGPETTDARKNRKKKKKKKPSKPSKPGQPGQPPSCSPACSGEKVCRDGSCVCPDDRNECRDRCCAKGEICSAGRCSVCTADPPEGVCGGDVCGSRVNFCGAVTSCGTCGGGQVCHHGQCIAQCPTEYRLCNGECLPEAFCCADAECQANMRCIGGTCGCPDGRVECNGRCCGDREMCDTGVCKRFECEKEFPELEYCGPYHYNCCPKIQPCCPRVSGMMNVCCFAEFSICCAALGGCCDRD